MKNNVDQVKLYNYIVVIVKLYNYSDIHIPYGYVEPLADSHVGMGYPMGNGECER